MVAQTKILKIIDAFSGRASLGIPQPLRLCGLWSWLSENPELSR